MGAMLAAGTLGFTSCSNEGIENAEDNPTFDGTAVKTQFAINVPAGVKTTTRMSDQVVQNNYQFNGMKNLFLASIKDDEINDNTAFQSVYRLPSIVETGTKNAGVQKVYENVTIPVGTKNFLFWGESAAEGVNKVTGVLNNNLSDNSVMSNNAVSFSLQKIDANGQIASEGQTLTNALNMVIKTGNADNKQWAVLNAVPEANKTDGEKEICRLMGALCKNNMRWAGSTFAIKNILTDLRAGLEAIDANTLNADASGASAFNSKSLRDNIVNEIKDQLNNIASLVNENFPENLDLPQGAATVQYNTTEHPDEFAFVYISSQTVLEGGSYLDASTLCYPTSLNYFVKTGARTNNAKQTIWPTSVNDWANKDWSTWGSEVLSSTQAIALKENINYSVARLDVNVKVANTTSLDDNAESLEHASGPSKIPSNMFKVTGIAIGGQPTECDWQVMPKTGATYSYTIWDSQVTNTNAITTSAQEFCKTLVLDNKCTGTQKDVVIAVEIMNGSGTDFCGYNGIIKAGAKFYMIASLSPGDGNKPSGISAEEEAKLDHVFVQDHNTVVTLTMNNLKNAYIGVPDLRSTDLQLGLSVDLKWEKGLEFNVNLQ